MKIRQTKLIAATLACGLLAAFMCGAAGAGDTTEIDAIKKILASSIRGTGDGYSARADRRHISGIFPRTPWCNVDRTGQYLLGGPLIATYSKTDLRNKRWTSATPPNGSSCRSIQAIKRFAGQLGNAPWRYSPIGLPLLPPIWKKNWPVLRHYHLHISVSLTSLHPDARNKAHALWCAPDRSEAWHDLDDPRQGARDAGRAVSEDPLDNLLAFGRTNKIASTPVIFWKMGTDQRYAGVRRN